MHKIERPASIEILCGQRDKDSHTLEDQVIRQAVMNCLSWYQDKTRETLADGFKAIVHIEEDSPVLRSSGKPRRVLSHNSAYIYRNGGVAADAKMRTLDLLEQSYTCPGSVDDLIADLKSAGFSVTDNGDSEIADDPRMQPLLDYRGKQTEQLPANVINWLVDVEHGAGIAPWYGGIKVGYRRYYDPHESESTDRHFPGNTSIAESEPPQKDGAPLKAREVTGVIKVAFSGCNQIVDLTIALSIYKDVAEALRQCNSGSIFLMDEATDLHQEPTVSFFAKLMGI